MIGQSSGQNVINCNETKKTKEIFGLFKKLLQVKCTIKLFVRREPEAAALYRSFAFSDDVFSF